MKRAATNRPRTNPFIPNNEKPLVFLQHGVREDAGHAQNSRSVPLKVLFEMADRISLKVSQSHMKARAARHPAHPHVKSVQHQ